MITKQQKKDIVKELAQKAKESKSIIFVNYKGLKVKDITELKSQLREAGVEYMVSRKTLIDIALKEVGVETSVKGLEGQIAVSFSKEDEVAAAKIIEKFAKKNNNLKMLGGVLGVQVMSQEEVKALAKIPSREELLAKMVGSIKAPVSGFVNVLSGNLRGLAQVLNAIKEQKA